VLFLLSEDVLQGATGGDVTVTGPSPIFCRARSRIAVTSTLKLSVMPPPQVTRSPTLRTDYMPDSGVDSKKELNPTSTGTGGPRVRPIPALTPRAAAPGPRS
jgi:hypothetical protein